ncbi:MAG: hypothetical protein K1Y02_01385 [Candidatus Hydrogenedentes bacterium]|nr:hypothetical protein [Candidatus Hydrogenedentota bacterium]
MKKLIAFLLIGAIPIAGIIISYLHHSEYGVDDAYITYRYALNLVNGHGLNFNTDGTRVEGYSNLLYVLMMAVGLLIVPPASIYYFSLCLNAVFLTVCAYVFYWFAQRETGERWACAAAFLFCLFTPLWYSAVLGMETPLVLLAQLGIWTTVTYVARREQSTSRFVFWLCVSSVASVLVRIDGFLMPAAAALYLILRGRYRPALLLAGLVALVVAVHFSFRYHYYGYWLPNTFYVKVDGPLFERVTSGIRSFFLIVLMADNYLVFALSIAAALVISMRRVIKERVALFEAVSFGGFFALLWQGYWVYIGGDWMGSRFMTILCPIGILSLLQLLDKYPRATFLGVTGACIFSFSHHYYTVVTFFKRPDLAHEYCFRVIVVLAVSSAVLYGASRAKILPGQKSILGALAAVVALTCSIPASFASAPFGEPKRDMWYELGHFLGKEYPHKTIAVDAAGKIPYFSGLHAIDMLGLNDTHIAHTRVENFVAGHSKHDAEYVLKQSPDIITCWIDTQLNMSYGLTRSRYIEGGYEVSYVLTDLPDKPIMLDVQNEPADKIKSLIGYGGYRYAVLTKGELRLR